MNAISGEPRSVPAGADAAFVARGVSKSYPGVRALDGVNLEGLPGEVLAICGANGAGKSTFARLLSGQEPPSAGTVHVRGYEHAIRSPSDADQAGVLLMHQEPLIIDDFSVGRNVWLHALRPARRSRPWSRPHRDDDERTREALRRAGLGDVAPGRRAGDLAPGQRQMLALSRAAVTPHKILILDETTASTTEAYFEQVVEMVEEEKRARVSVVFVSHRMQEVLALADRIAVLRNGELLEVLDTVATDVDQVTSLMIGDAVKVMHRPPASATGQDGSVLRVERLSHGSATDVSFEAAPGEIVGIYGLVGSGRSSVARAITGQQTPRAGRVLLGDHELRLTSPASAVREQIAYITEDRRREGFVADFANRENLSLVTLKRIARAGVIRRRQELERAEELIDRFGIKGTAKTPTRTLSGGNQQKVCIAKWLQADPKVVVLDEPTKGIDVGARTTIYELIYDLAERGKVVVVVSSEAEEILLLAHRVFVMRAGAIVAEHEPETATTEDLGRDALGQQGS